jgi:hypothetical protein
MAAPDELCTFDVSAVDYDGTIDSITAAPLPAGASFTYAGDGEGTFEWSPLATDLGDHDILFTAYDNDDLTDSEQITITVSAGCCTPPMRGDINADGIAGETGIDVSDVVYLVNYMFKQGPPPPCFEEANINGSGGEELIDIADLVYLVNYMFKDGPEPSPCP